MLKHNLLIIYRGFKRFKGTFLINLIGLSTGLACVLLIYLWINDELSFDKFHEKDSRLYQIMANHHNAEGIVTGEFTPDLLAETLAEELPQVEKATALVPAKWFDSFVLTVDNKNLKTTGQFADEDFFDIFSYKLLGGDKTKVLSDKNGVVISKEFAYKLFGGIDKAIGKTIEWQLIGFKNTAFVTGVFEDVPQNSSNQFELIVSFESWKELSKNIGRPIHWDNHGPSAYVVLKEGTDVEQFNKKIEGFIKTKYANSNVTLFARKYSDAYLYDNYENGVQAGGRIEYVNIFSITAVFILLIACINFMNLSTAKASRRVKEVGVKKAIGAGRKDLAVQYLGESLLMAFLSMFLAIVLTEIFLPQFNEITGKNLSVNINLNTGILILGITVLTGLLAGSYPALYLSGFNPISILKGKLKSSPAELITRKGFVIVQFTLSLIFIVAVLVAFKQFEYIQTKNLGYTKDNIIYFGPEGKLTDHLETFFTEVKKIPGVVNASSIRGSVIGNESFTIGLSWKGKNPDDVVRFGNLSVNYDLIETLGIKMKEGRSFSRSFGSDTTAIILNEAAADIIGFDNPVGKTVNLWGNDMQIIGIAKNFHLESLHESIKPYFIILRTEPLDILVKIKAGMEKETLAAIGSLYEKINPGFTFDFKFIDEDYQAMYAAEKRVTVLSKYFAGLAIIISCLGLFGLAAFTAEQRTKEIGIRKVLGAGTKGLVLLLSKDFLKLVLIAFILAVPAAWYLMNNWLQGFAYRIDISWWMFVGAGLAAFLIALITVSYQAFKAATANPVKSLKYE